MAAFKKPALWEPHHFDRVDEGSDPAVLAAAGQRIATLLVRGAAGETDSELAERLLHLTNDEGLATIAELWSHAAASSLAGALWRLYVLGAWVKREPVRAAHEFDLGRRHSHVDEVLAGISDPPGPSEVVAMIDTVIRGILAQDFDVTLDRAASFAHVIALGRTELDDEDPRQAAKLADTARTLRAAAKAERAGTLA